MTVKDLLKLFSMYPKDTTVLAFDSEVSYPVPVTGMVFDESNKTLELTTDDPS